MSVFDRARKQVDETPPIILGYGVDGVGKTTFACDFPDAFYLGTPGERVPVGSDVTGDEVRSFLEMIEAMEDFLYEKHDYKWLIMDSLDGFEPQVWEETCYRINKESIEKLGYGKGYVEADTEWHRYLDLCGKLKQAGVGVIQLAHPEIVRFDSPMTEPYNQYTIKLHKRANALVREKADIVTFMNYRVDIKETEISRDKKVSHAEGGKDRVLYFNGSPAYVAKNRYGMPDSVRFKMGKGYDSVCEFFPPATGVR